VVYTDDRLAKVHAAEERRKREDDKERIARSVKESRAQLDKIIAAWGEVRNLELFFQGVEASTRLLPEDERERVLSRLALARSFVGTQDPMDFFLGWKTPRERYRPRFSRDGCARRSRGVSAGRLRIQPRQWAGVCELPKQQVRTRSSNPSASISSTLSSNAPISARPPTTRAYPLPR
jgi:hypothetical protein